jgi:ABC-type methionine transport system permease subunit
VNVTVAVLLTPLSEAVIVAIPAVREVMFAAARPFVVSAVVVGELLSVNVPKFVLNVTCVPSGTGALFKVALTEIDTGVVAATVELDADTSKTVPLVLPPPPLPAVTPVMPL